MVKEGKGIVTRKDPVIVPPSQRGAERSRWCKRQKVTMEIGQKARKKGERVAAGTKILPKKR